MRLFTQFSKSADLIRFLFQHGRPYRGLLLASSACMVILGASTGALAFLTGPAFTFFLKGGRSGLEVVTNMAPEWVNGVGSRAWFVIPGLMVFLGGVKGLSYLGQFYFTGLYGQRVSMSLRRLLFQQFSRLSMKQKIRTLTGDLLSRFSVDLPTLELAASTALSSYFRDGFQVLILVCTSFYLSWKLAGLAMVLLPLAIWPARKFTKTFARKTAEALHRMGTLSGQVHEGLGALKTVQAYNGQSAEMLRFDAEASLHEKNMIKASWARGAVPAVMEVLAAASIGGLLGYAAFVEVVAPEVLVSLLMCVGFMAQPAKEIGRATQFLLQAQASAARLQEVFGASIDSWPGKTKIPPVSREIRFENVRFAYEGKQQVLTNLTLSLPCAKMTALLGPSGGGKSTLVSLLLGFLEPAEGRIAIDGVNIREIEVESLRKQFAWISQEPLLFSTSIFENIRLAFPGASLNEVRKVAQAVFLDEFVETLPLKYETLVGERGHVLSGGQKQRIALARALLSQAPVLLLDEPTSNLDAQSENEVLQSIRAVSKARTVVFISHRLKAVMDADKIFVLSEGRVFEQGTHEELMNQEGLYARLWRLQNHEAFR